MNATHPTRSSRHRRCNIVVSISSKQLHEALRGCGTDARAITTMARRQDVKESVVHQPSKTSSARATDDHELILQSIGEGVHVLDAAGHVPFVNPSTP